MFHLVDRALLKSRHPLFHHNLLTKFGRSRKHNSPPLDDFSFGYNYQFLPASPSNKDIQAVASGLSPVSKSPKKFITLRLKFNNFSLDSTPLIGPDYELASQIINDYHAYLHQAKLTASATIVAPSDSTSVQFSFAGKLDTYHIVAAYKKSHLKSNVIILFALKAEDLNCYKPQDLSPCILYELIEDKVKYSGAPRLAFSQRLLKNSPGTMFVYSGRKFLRLEPTKLKLPSILTRDVF
jgi:hypothetical protein